MDIDPYTRENPIGPGTALSSYKSGGNAVGTGLKYAALVRRQETLDVSGIDVGLAVLVAAHQARLKQQAAEFVDTVAADFIQLASDVGNFEAVFGAFAANRQPLEAVGWESVRDQLTSIADYAGEVGSDGDTAVDHVTILQTDLGRIAQRLDSALERGLAAVGEDGKAASARIDELTKKISENIQAIVDGANETGDAVTALGIGVLTEITKHTGDKPTPPAPGDDSGDGASDTESTGSSASADGATTRDRSTGSAVDVGSGSDGGDGSGDDDASTTKKADGKVPDVSFVVSAIKAGAKGTEKYTAAMADLQRNNDLLAVQYQRLATANRLIAVAKVTQAQQSLFAASVTETAEAVKAIRAGWSALRDALAGWSHRSDASSTAQIDRLVPGALKQWQAVTADLSKMKRALTSSDRRSPTE